LQHARPYGSDSYTVAFSCKRRGYCDGAYGRNVDGSVRFWPVAAPDDEDVAQVAMRVYRRVLKLFDSDSDEFGAREPGMAAIAAASLRKMVATGGRKGLPVRRLKAGEWPTSRLMGNRCAEVQGFNIHANVRLEGNNRQGLEALCRYVGRPPLSDARLEEREDGNLSLRLKRAWSDGTTHLLLSPGEVIEKLIPLIPRPRAHTMRYHGVLAPASGWRGESIRIPWADLLKRVFKIDVLACSANGIDRKPRRDTGLGLGSERCEQPPLFTLKPADEVP